jgi:primosomal protein N' (replication factor Y)
MMSGEAVIAVGARSAVFAPVRDLGLIVIDEEHEASYKQESLPRYNAREVAEERARLAQAPLILGSATPSVETFYLASRTTSADASGRPRILEMPTRIDNRPLPRVSVVDLREEFKQRKSLFSEALLEAMMLRLKRKQQTILFLNRRGYAQFILCRDCGFVAKCPNCAISLAFHAIDRTLRCHHCDHTAPVPQICPDCSGMKIRTFGVGTEKVEEEVLRAFPEARVARMDRDTTARKGSHARIIHGFRTGDAEILIGTQMVAKGFDFPNVTLVGVISADSSLNVPDFRAAERSFQLLTQVAGRAGRGTTPGDVIIQTFAPDHFAVKAAVRQNYRRFYEREIQFRSELNYPPFSRLANLICSDADERVAERRAIRLSEALRTYAGPDVEVIGPSPAPIARLRNMFRFHVALRAPREAPLYELVRVALASLAAPERRGIAIDIDPQSMA